MISLTGYKHTEEWKRLMSEKMKGNQYSLGHHHTEETKKILSDANKGNRRALGYHHTDEAKRKISETHKGRTKLEASKIKQGAAIRTPEWRRNISLGKLKGAAPKSGMSVLFRHRAEWAKWREAVFSRDNYTCQACAARGGEGKRIYLEPHHLKRLSEYPGLVYDIDNGLTLCGPCHNLTKGGRNGN